jgi:hypothetical protein
LATQSGSTQEKQRQLERRISAIEKKMGLSGGADARAQISSLQRQLSLARAAVRAIIKAERNKDLHLVHLTSRAIKLRLHKHIIRKSFLAIYMVPLACILSHDAVRYAQATGSASDFATAKIEE